MAIARDIAPAILRLHPGLDSRQLEVIAHADGPLLVIAGPGSGKTLCVALRAVNLLLTGRAKPGELALCTFGRSAARELQERFTTAAKACGVPGDISTAGAGTIHSLCHRVLTAHAETVGLRPGYRLLDEQEQRLLLQREFGAVFGPDRDILSGRGWRHGMHAASEAARYFDRICDELIDAGDLAGSERPFTAALGRSLLRYRELLLEYNAVDFAHLQVWAHRVLQDDPVAAAAGGAARHLMVDEFQDTSRVQLHILERLAKAHGNIVVVGDDDQSIYRFRGASVANLLEFPLRYPGCRTVELGANYRSHRNIVSATSRWMAGAAPWETGGQCHRYAKSAAPHAPETHGNYPAVISVLGQDPRDEAAQLGELLRFLRESGVIASYGQAALLLHSVRDEFSNPYLDGLERAGIPVCCAPAGHDRIPTGGGVVVTTIHQAKGREWDAVIVGSLDGPDMETDRIGRTLAGYGVYSGEPEDLIGEFDRARQHYVALTRARHLLVLTAAGEPGGRFRQIWHAAVPWPSADRDSLSRQRFGPAAAGPRRVFDVERLDRLVIRLNAPR